MWDSVTVSMAELTTGTFRPILRVSQVLVSDLGGEHGTARGYQKHVIEG